MAEIEAMWIGEPDPTPPDVVARGAFKCGVCGFHMSVGLGYPRTATLRTRCFCGTDVEITQPEQSDGASDE